MRIDHLNVTIRRPTQAQVAALLNNIASQPPVDLIPGTLMSSLPPRIGEPWPGVAGIYAGLARGLDGEPDGHLVLLDALPDPDLDWAAAVAWAEGLADGARLPTRFESALLYANLRDQLDTSRWHWTGTQYSADNAWFQGFDYGYQHFNGKSFKARARAVRRFAA
jgi:hypothetical protein